MSIKKKIITSKLNIAVFVFFITIGITKLFYQDRKIYINITPSIKPGIYMMRKYEKKIPLKKGTFVIFSVPGKATKNREYYQDFIKEIVGIYGDDIEIIDNKIYINDEFKGDIFEKDSYGNNIRTLKEGKQEIREDEYFVMGSNPKSYDSRYWGAIKQQDILYFGTFYIPFTWEK
ncbi:MULTISPECIES: signal peptidase I [Fusobacterium]|uniref:signal peptidase I n=1 Tax=Fusobacterium TaxID=848 RepID=UPI0003B8F418|nr:MULTISPECIES: signal peptidase I [Fusobacterium]ERT34878.1 conjugative transfer signal peptidase TraF [Fusobacterium nucleatum CTI-3]EUB35056.1 signal peptidase I [Fusobacterium sp. CM1]